VIGARTTIGRLVALGIDVDDGVLTEPSSVAVPSRFRSSTRLRCTPPGCDDSSWPGTVRNKPPSKRRTLEDAVHARCRRSRPAPCCGRPCPWHRKGAEPTLRRLPGVAFCTSCTAPRKLGADDAYWPATKVGTPVIPYSRELPVRVDGILERPFLEHLAGASTDRPTFARCPGGRRAGKCRAPPRSTRGTARRGWLAPDCVSAHLPSSWARRLLYVLVRSPYGSPSASIRAFICACAALSQVRPRRDRPATDLPPACRCSGKCTHSTFTSCSA